MTYPSQIPESLQATILDWFQFRDIAGTEDTFPVYFNRVLNRDYRRYNELLKLEPGTVEYEWLILRKISGSSSQTSEGSESGSGSNTLEHGHIIDTAGSNSEQGSDNLTHGLVVDTSQDNSHTGTVDHKTTASAEDNYTDSVGSDTNSGSLSRVHKQDADSNYDTGSGSSSSSDNRSNTSKQVNSGNTADKTETLLKQGYSDSSSALTKNTPQSIIYSDDEVADGLASRDGVPSLDWHYATNQNQNYNIHKIVGDDPDVTQSNGSSSSETDITNTESGSNEASNSNKTAYNRDETTTDTDTRKVDRSNKQSVNKNEDVLDTYNESTSNSSKVTNSGSDITTSSKEGSNSSKVTNSGSDVTNSTNSKQTSNKVTNSNSDEGRIGYNTISSILQDAVNFIEATDAWEWLASRLEVCFIGVYDI